MREKFWELAGSKLGNILKVPGKEEPSASSSITDAKGEGDDVDYKTDS